MLKSRFSRTLLLIVVALLMLLPSAVAFGAADYENTDTGYTVIIEDDAELLSEWDKRLLLEDMKPITQWGHVAFHSCNETAGRGYEEYADYYYHQHFGKESGTLFMIDMRHRKIYIFSDGEVYGSITSYKAEVITDNIYEYASHGDYYSCASKAYSQIAQVLRGERIAQPMKYICNAIIAVFLAVLICFIIVSRSAKMKKAKNDKIINAATHFIEAGAVTSTFINETRRHAPRSSGGGGGFSGGGGGGGGGGGSSGGGGGHSF